MKVGWKGREEVIKSNYAEVRIMLKPATWYARDDPTHETHRKSLPLKTIGRNSTIEREIDDREEIKSSLKRHSNQKNISPRIWQIFVRLV